MIRMAGSKLKISLILALAVVAIAASVLVIGGIVGSRESNDDGNSSSEENAITANFELPKPDDEPAGGRIEEEIEPIDDKGNPESVRKAYLDIYNNASQESRMVWMADGSGEKPSLDGFFSANESTISKEVFDLLDNEKADIFSCGNDGSIKNISMVMYANLDLYKGDIYDGEISAMKAWEASILKDTKGIFFPKDEWARTDWNQRLRFKDGAYRYSEVSLSGGSRGSLNYAIVDEYIIVSNSRNCIDETIKQLYYTDTD